MPDLFTVGFVTGGQCAAPFVRSLAVTCMHYSDSELPRRIAGTLMVQSGPRIAAARNQLVEAFLAQPGPDWLLMVDDDMVWSPDTIEHMFTTAHTHGVTAVSGLAYGLDTSGAVPVMWQISDGTIRRVTEWEQNEIVDVAATGAACLLVHRSVLEAVGRANDHPWRWFQEGTVAGEPAGEDVVFGLRVTSQLGIRLVVDTAAEFGHVKPLILGSDAVLWSNALG